MILEAALLWPDVLRSLGDWLIAFCAGLLIFSLTGRGERREPDR